MKNRQIAERLIDAALASYTRKGVPSNSKTIVMMFPTLQVEDFIALQAKYNGKINFVFPVTSNEGYDDEQGSNS